MIFSLLRNWFDYYQASYLIHDKRNFYRAISPLLFSPLLHCRHVGILMEIKNRFQTDSDTNLHDILKKKRKINYICILYT